MQDSSELGLMVNPDPRDLDLTVMPNSRAVGLGPCQTRTWVWHQTWLPDPRPLSLTLVSDPSKQHTNKQMIIVHFICQEREKKEKTYVDHTRPKSRGSRAMPDPHPSLATLAYPRLVLATVPDPCLGLKTLTNPCLVLATMPDPYALVTCAWFWHQIWLSDQRLLGLTLLADPRTLGLAWYLNSSSLGLACLSDPSK